MHIYPILPEVEVSTALLLGCFLILVHKVLSAPSLFFPNAPSHELPAECSLPRADPPPPTAIFTLWTPCHLPLNFPPPVFPHFCALPSRQSVVFTLPGVELGWLPQELRGRNRAGSVFFVLLWKLALEYQKGKPEGSRS